MQNKDERQTTDQTTRPIEQYWTRVYEATNDNRAIILTNFDKKIK